MSSGIIGAIIISPGVLGNGGNLLVLRFCTKRIRRSSNEEHVLDKNPLFVFILYLVVKITYNKYYSIRRQ